MQRETGWKLQNKFKPLITEEVHNVESKNVDFGNRTTARLYVILSNSENHLPLEDGDRRAWVSTYGQPRREPEFYDALHAAMPTEAPGFLHSLLIRDISRFNPNKAPPMTEAKQQLIADCRPPLERQLAEMLDAGDAPFARDLVVPSHLLLPLSFGGFKNVTVQQVRRALKGMGASACTNALPPVPQLGVAWSKEPRV